MGSIHTYIYASKHAVNEITLNTQSSSRTHKDLKSKTRHKGGRHYLLEAANETRTSWCGLFHHELNVSNSCLKGLASPERENRYRGRS